MVDPHSASFSWNLGCRDPMLSGAQQAFSASLDSIGLLAESDDIRGWFARADTLAMEQASDHERELG